VSEYKGTSFRETDVKQKYASGLGEGTPPKHAVKKLISTPIPVTDHAGL
jgi:hypothetical protein